MSALTTKMVISRMSEKIVTLFPNPVTPNAVLESALSSVFDGVVVIGRLGDEMVISTSYENFSEILWELKQAERAVLRK